MVMLPRRIGDRSITAYLRLTVLVLEYYGELTNVILEVLIT